MDVLGFLSDVCVDFFLYVVSECEANGIDANANTEANYSTYVSGEFEYNWITPDGTTIETMPFTLSSGMSDLEVIGNSGTAIRWLAGVYDSDTPDVTVQQVGNDVDIRTTAQMHLYINGNLVNVSNYITSSCRISSSYQATYGYNNNGTYYYYPNDGVYGRSVIGHLSDVHATSNQTLSNNYPDAVYIPAPSTGTISYNDYILQVVDWTTINYPDLNITINDLPSWAELASETETETESECCSCNCNTTIYVNADGSLTLQNDISGDFDLSINNDADLSLNINAAAGAFGAGAVVIDPDAEINITAGAGAFGAGAFGAGAIVSPNVSVSGNVDVGDISGEVNLNASDISFDISGGDVNIDQSGATNNNTYNTTNNYYYDPSEPEQEPFSIDYNEILSEGELESILIQETYDIDTFPTDFIDGDNLILPSKPTEDYLPVAIQATPDLLNAFSDLIVDTGCSSFYFPLGIFSVLCYCIRGHR